MLTVGGANNRNDVNDQDPFKQGLGIFDMTDLTWKREGHYDADAEPYKSPRVVEEWYKGKDLSTMSWASDEVKEIFLAQPLTFDKPTSSSTSPTESTTAPVMDLPPNTDFGAIIGGVVGGVAVLGVLAGVVYFFRFRKSRLSLPPGKLENGGETDSVADHTTTDGRFCSDPNPNHRKHKSSLPKPRPPRCTRRRGRW